MCSNEKWVVFLFHYQRIFWSKRWLIFVYVPFVSLAIQIENLEDLLKEKDNQVEMARARLSAMQAHHCNSEGALYSMEETLGDKDKQMQLLRDQRDRAEKDKEEERELHEREVTEYKLKLHSLECDIEKLNSRLDRIHVEKERLETRLESSQSELGKSKAEYDKVSGEVGRSTSDWEATKQRMTRLELENDRLRHELERSQVGINVCSEPNSFSYSIV